MKRRTFTNPSWPPWVKVTLVWAHGSVYVYVHSRIHVRRRKRCSCCYSTSLPIDKILRDNAVVTAIASYR